MAMSNTLSTKSPQYVNVKLNISRNPINIKNIVTNTTNLLQYEHFLNCIF